MKSMPVLGTIPASASLLGCIYSCLFACLSPSPVRADETVQIPVASILNCRSVTTLTDGKLVTWSVGVDGGGGADGYLTMAASKFMNDPNLKALPDSGKVPADARHPEVVLNYSNADGSSNQTRYVRAIGDFTVPLPQAKYSKLFMFFTSAEGKSPLIFKLTYSDSSESINVLLPDYADVITNHPVLFNLITGLAKWNKENKWVEKTNHNIDGVELHPAAGKTLIEVKVSKTAAAGYLVFWGATGIATATPVTVRLRDGRGKQTGASRMGRLFSLGEGKLHFEAAGEAMETFSATGRLLKY